MKVNRRLQIGMWNGLDPQRWEAYANERITGLEISQFGSVGQMEELAQFIKERKLAYGIHTPVLGGQGYSLPGITSIDRVEREEAFVRLEQEAELASRFGADYVLTHYPYPSIFPTIQDERYLTRLPHFERYQMGQIDRVDFMEHSRRAFEKISELQVMHRQRIVLEYDFFGDFEYKYVTSLFEEYPDIKLVVDLQRFDIHKRVFPEFDPYIYMDAVAEHVYLVHYSNVKYEHDKMDRHLPVLPAQQSDPDYGDAYGYLDYLSQRNNQFHLTFEHNPARVTKQELLLCYESAAAIMMKECLT
jgi:sugar phosphate isomerase/epimerase